MTAHAAVSLAAYRHNIRLMRERVAPAELMAVLKADAYGHGLLPVARTAVDEGVSWLGCLDTATGLQLRQAGVPRQVQLFAWLFGPDEDYGDAIDAGIDIGVSTVRQLAEIAASRSADRARLHLKVDTGLHRNGADVLEWPALVLAALELERSGRAEIYGVWTHISEASEAEDSLSIERFHTAIAVAESLGATFTLRHLAASAAAFERVDARFDLVRIGAFGYGIAPGGGISPASLGLVPVLTLAAPVLESGADSSTIGIGYADGVPSSAAGRVSVAVDGVRHPVLEVGLDSTIIGGRAVAGELATLFGPGADGEQTLQEWADALDTIGEELVTRISRRIPRKY